MTDVQKAEFRRTTYSAFIAAVLSSLVIFIFQGFTDDKKDIKKELQTKAPYSYVDQKCLETRQEAKDDNEQLIDRINTLDKNMNEKLDLIIKYVDK